MPSKKKVYFMMTFVFMRFLFYVGVIKINKNKNKVKTK